jgi:hypothetical protein
MGAFERFQGAIALGFCGHPTPQRASVLMRPSVASGAVLAKKRAVLPKKPPTPEGQGELKRGVKRCATGKATRPGSTTTFDLDANHLESGNPLLDTGTRANSTQLRARLGAALIRRRLCETGLAGFLVHPDDEFPTPEPWPLPLAPGGRGASRSEGERGPPSAPQSMTPPCPPLPLGEGLAKQGVRASPGAPNAPTLLSPTRRPDYG